MNQAIRPITMPSTSSVMGQNQSRWKKVRSTSASESGGGAYHQGNILAMPNCCAAGDCTKYWCQSSPSNAPDSRLMSEEVT